MKYWLMKSEPDSFSLDDLRARGTEPWTGVRNFVARNYMREMAIGDRVLFYHSNVPDAPGPGVAGLATVCATSHVDDTAFDPDHMYYDPQSKRDAPRWDCVDVKYDRHFAHYVPLDRLRADPPLAGMLVLMKGQRLSVQPVERAHFERIVALAETAWTAPPKPKAIPKPKPKPKKPATKKPVTKKR